MPVYTIKSYLGLTHFATTGRVLVRAPDGTLWCTYVYSTGTGLQVYVSYSTDDGVTWTEELVAALPGTHQSRPAIAVDSNGDVHVVWYGKGWGANPTKHSVQYRTRVAGVWQAQEEVANYAYFQRLPVIAVDSNDVIHVVFESGGGIGLPNEVNIAHRHRIAGVWQTPSMVIDDDTGNSYPSIAIDSANNIHISFLKGDHAPGDAWRIIAYVVGTPGSWAAFENVAETAQSYEAPIIALDQSDQPHLAWVYYDWALTRSIQYSWRLAGVWQSVETLPFVADEIQEHPTLAVDMAGNVHAGWSGRGWGANPGHYNVLHLVRDPGGWPAVPEIVIDSANTDFQTNFLWAMYPVTDGLHRSIPLTGYALGYIEAAVGSDIAKIILSSDLSWPTAIVRRKGNIVIDQLIYQHAERMRR